MIFQTMTYATLICPPKPPPSFAARLLPCARRPGGYAPTQASDAMTSEMLLMRERQRHC